MPRMHPKMVRKVQRQSLKAGFYKATIMTERHEMSYLFRFGKFTIANQRLAVFVKCISRRSVRAKKKRTG